MGLNQKVLFDELVFLQDFHRIWKTIVLLPAEVDLAEGSSADDLEHVEIIERYFLARVHQVLGRLIALGISFVIHGGVLGVGKSFRIRADGYWLVILVKVHVLH